MNKNVHTLATKNSKIGYVYESEQYHLFTNGEDPHDICNNLAAPKHLYITSEEDINDGDWCLDIRPCEEGLLHTIIYKKSFHWEYLDSSTERKIVFTTDSKLIEDNIQEISEEFLKYFVKNPCDYIEVQKGFEDGSEYGYNFLEYKIIIA